MILKSKIKAYAKLNLFLDITGKRADNYHDILTAMCLVDLADDITVTVEEGTGVSITCSDSGIPKGGENSAYKAAVLFAERIKADKRIDIDIIKKIPVMAGLGGSSADAAAVLRGLNTLMGGPLSLGELLETGAATGSDVPFCIRGGMALCAGTGTEITADLPVPDCVFLIIKPEFSCSTKEAYGLYGANPLPVSGETELFLKAAKRGDYSCFAKHMYNAFEILYANPEIERLKNELTSAGARGACLTGSGSAVFGVFDNAEQAGNALNKLDYKIKFIARPVKKEALTAITGL